MVHPGPLYFKAAAGAFAFNAIREAFVAANGVFVVRFPLALNARQSCSRDSPAWPASCAMPLARATTPRELAMKAAPVR